MTAKQPPRIFEHLDVLDDAEPRSAALNMAIDEALLLAQLPKPILRTYRWAQPAVSFGYFESWTAVSARFSGRELVRRWTGGGAVEHGSDFTYSLIIPRTHPLTNLPTGESYRLIHLAIQRCLKQLGVEETELSNKDTLGGATLRECFAQPVQHDLLQAGRKLAGAAQRRTRQGLLHQGSLAALDAEKLDPLQLGRMLPTILSEHAKEFKLRETEFLQAVRLAAEKYGAPGWMHRA